MFHSEKGYDETSRSVGFVQYTWRIIMSESSDGDASQMMINV